MSLPYAIKSKVIKIGDYAADSNAIKHPLFANPRKIKVNMVHFGHSVAVTAVDTNYNTIAVVVGATVIAQVLTGPAATGQDFVAGDYVPITPEVGDEVIAAGANIELSFTKTGNGLLGKGLVVQIDYYEYDT